MAFEEEDFFLSASPRFPVKLYDQSENAAFQPCTMKAVRRGVEEGKTKHFFCSGSSSTSLSKFLFGKKGEMGLR